MSTTAKAKPKTRAKAKEIDPADELNEASVIETRRFVRLVPGHELPRYTYVPGQPAPHPFRDPRGHSYQKKPATPRPLVNEDWADNRHYLVGLDLFNLGFYWEANDEWERVLKVCGPDTTEATFLKGLSKLAASGVKVREGSIHGVRRHAASAGEVFADVAAETDLESFCGMNFTQIQFAADRAAQLTYRNDMEPGRPLRVFPFFMLPEPLPLNAA